MIVYFFYEEPQLLLSKSKTGQNFLSLLTNMDEKEWLLAPISDTQLSLLKINRISCREVYTKPEDGFVWRISIMQLTGQ
jgi:hypothetical protein